MRASTAEGRWIRNPVWSFSCVTPAGTSTSLTSRINEMKTHTRTHTLAWEDQCERHRMTRMTGPDCAVMCNLFNKYTHTRSTPVAQSAPRNLLTRWDVSSIPANGIFLTKNKKNKIKMPNGWRTINSLVHKIRLHGRRGKGMAESFSRQKSRHAPQKEGGLEILCDLPPV